MIKVNVVEKDNTVIRINVTGHAEAGAYGNDLVCAGVSTILFGSLNGLDYFNSNDVELVVEENEITVSVIKDSKQLELLLRFILIQLKTVEDQYSKNIKIKYTEV